ncbi:hypothetical protein PHYBOEH_008121 [Phytophthora boehmeriae]|uniref:Uncharacterized protein n=1 Tax=Phytophthora boehmeriae TaxID=109152 RepID=A0A8T1W6L7_9STRA|nr:hypothetical protein PHYBOEH_008121 [Phytophthora boehmeriae]
MKDEASRHSATSRPALRSRRSSVDDPVAPTPAAVRAAARATLKEEETRPAAVEASSDPSRLKPRPPSTPRESNAADSKTFLTALVPAQRRSRKQSEVLRPPSPLESLEPSSDYAESGERDPPVPANYMGFESMRQFWNIFHRQETVHNNKMVPTPPSSSVTAPESSTTVPGRPKSARTTYLAAIRNFKLCPEPLGIELSEKAFHCCQVSSRSIYRTTGLAM